MSEEASAPNEAEKPSASPTTLANSDGTSRISALSSFRNRIRSRLSSSGVGVRLKSLVKWRRASEMKVRAGKGLAMSASSSQTRLDVPVNIADDPSKRTPANQIIHSLNESRIESQENKSNEPQNLIESNIVSNSFDPGTSSVSTVDSIPSYVTAEDAEVSTTNFVETTNQLTDEIINDELNPINDEESLSIPSTVIGVQINTSLAARILDVVPILYIENGSLNSSSNTRSTRTGESFASNSSGSEDSAGSTSNGVIEIVTARDESRRRFEDDYVRPYYDLSVRPIIRKQFHQLDDDPPIY